ncbi:hypothetical protein [Streptomyces sp. NBC_00690]|uniref:hypothetical protein n=1 Tax=Streptomyces sp. NBC_00690 TaxID=2975808 RepID=UPI002E2A6257|nr:hypothetical protein [Streptomyces sp. NBC_00690]
MPNQSDDSAVDVRERYAVQIRADLDQNRAEQGRIRDEMAELTERLNLLQGEESLLADLSDRVSPSPASAEEQKTSEEPGASEATGADADTISEPSSDTAVPRPRKKRSSKSGAVRAGTEAKFSADSASGAPAGGEAVADGQADKPNLRTAVLHLLREHREPRTVKEVGEEVTRAYSHLTPTGGVVRDALGALVAKGAVERDKRQGAVWYSIVEPAPVTDNGVSTETATADA